RWSAGRKPFEGGSRMKTRVIVVAALGAALLWSVHARAQTNLRVGWCARTISSAAAPFALATKMGWFAKTGISVQLIPLPGSPSCVKLVATKELDASLPSIEPVAVIHAQGVRIRTFYTAYQGNVYGFAVPAESTIRSIADIKGKRIGVIGMS